MYLKHIPLWLLTLTLLAPAVLHAQNTAPIELDGFIEPYEVVNIGTGVSGIIDSMNVDRGDIVKKGQILANLDTRVEKTTVDLIREKAAMEATTDLANARVEFATREQERRKELFEKGIIPDYDMDEGQTNLVIARKELQEVEESKQIARLELKQAEAVLARRIILSPINGVVVERYLAPGELASDKPILKLAQLDPLNVEVIAPVSLLGSIRVGRKVQVIPEGPLGKTYVGKVKIVDRVVDAASGTFGIRIELSNRDLSLPAGLKCRVRF
jgi:RND family efflux transporter MFP subunit